MNHLQSITFLYSYGTYIATLPHAHTYATRSNSVREHLFIHLHNTYVVCVKMMENTACDRDDSLFMLVAATVRSLLPTDMDRSSSL